MNVFITSILSAYQYQNDKLSRILNIGALKENVLFDPYGKPDGKTEPPDSSSKTLTEKFNFQPNQPDTS